MKRTLTAFVLMPFAEPYNSYYPSIFKPALEQAGYSVSRADDLFAPRPIMQDIAKSIKRADIILCEMSGKNPNVFYELGLAHAVGKPVILVSQTEEDIPFDLRHIRVILYNYKDANWGTKLRNDIILAAHEILSSPNELWPPPLLPESVTFPHQNIRILKGRKATVALLSQIVSRADRNDLIFGSCTTCADYPRAFYEELPRAVSRGANILFVAQDRPDSEGFIRIILQLKEQNQKRVKILKSKLVYLRLFGIKDKEVILALPLEDEFIGLYFNEPRVAQFLKIGFDVIVKNSTAIL